MLADRTWSSEAASSCRATAGWSRRGAEAHVIRVDAPAAEPMRLGWVPSCLALAIGGSGAFFAWRAGGAGEPRPLPPQAPVDAPSDAARGAGAPREQRTPARGAVAAGPGGEAEEVVVRLVDALKDARFEAPSMRAGLAALEPHWRKMQVPWTGLSGAAAKAAISSAILASEEEKEYVVPLANGDVWKPDARMWNMAEGSFDERDAIFAPTPAQVTYRLAVPLHASLEFSYTTDNAPGEVAFAVRITDARGEAHEVWAEALGRRDIRKWLEARVDLSAFGGQSVELTLATSTRSPATHADVAGAPASRCGPTRSSSRASRRACRTTCSGSSSTPPAPTPSRASTTTRRTPAKRAAPRPPLEALLPKLPGLTPELDALGKRGVRFTHAYSAAPWTRPGTVAMLGGARSTELGLDSLHWVPPDSEVTRFYASDPPLLPLLLRRQGRGHARVREQLLHGRVRLGRRRSRLRGDRRLSLPDARHGGDQSHAVEWLKAHKDERFFVFCNYNSPHEPLDPPARLSRASPRRRPGRPTRRPRSTWRRSRRTTRPSAC